MGKLKWNVIQRALVASDTVPEPPPAEEFWADFKARASLAGRAPALSAARSPSVAWARFAWTTAAVAVVSALLLVPLLRKPDVVSIAAVPVGTSTVEEIEVYVPYSSVMILEDEETGGTIVWLDDLDAGSGS